MVCFPVRARDLSLLWNCQTGCGDHLVSYLKVNPVISFGVNRPRARCCRPVAGRQQRGCIIPQTVTHSLVLLKMGKIISRNMLSWLELLISRYCCILVGCLYYLYQWCTIKQISNNEIYLLIKYIKSVLWRVTKRLSSIEDARCLKVNCKALTRAHLRFVEVGNPCYCVQHKFLSDTVTFVQFYCFLFFVLDTIKRLRFQRIACFYVRRS